MARKRDKTPGAAPSKREILAYIETADANVTRRDIARAFGVKGPERAELRRLLKEMADDGLIAKWAGKKVSSIESLPDVAVVDIVGRDTDGELLGMPAKWAAKSAPPKIYLAPGEGAGGKGAPAIGVGDRVLARLAKQGDVYEARIIKRLGQSAHRILGAFRKTPGGGRVEPVDRKARHDVTISAGDVGEARDGDLVVIELRTDHAYGLKRGVVQEVVGRLDDPKAISIIAIHAHRIPTAFSQKALDEAENAASPGAENRVDLRATPLITIDPADARDHDDAVWAGADDNPKNKGGWKIIVAIADVSYFVRPGSGLDKDAAARGNSVYLPDRVVPMLPERLSNGLCSLREGEDRPCLAVEMRFDKQGRKIAHKFMRAIMRSAAKLSYEQAQAAIDGKPDKAAKPFLEPVLKPLYAAYAALAAARADRNPLDLDLPERRLVFDKTGKVSGVALRDRFDAHKLVEEFMIQANVAAAEALEEKRAPVVYRVHDEPDPEKTDSLRDYLQSVDYAFPKGQVLKPVSFNRVLEIARGREEVEMISEVVLRAQAQAVYAIENLGHFGLNLARYAHFTSPIRRYADLLVHRALVGAYKLGPGALSKDGVSRLKETAGLISNYERRAMAAERDSLDRHVAAFMQGREGAEFDARITGVTRFGVFVRLADIGAEGLCPIRTLGAEYFHHDESLHALIGETTGLVYRLGQPARVRLEEATPLTGGLRFEMLSPPEKLRDDRPGGRAKTKRRGRRSPGPKKHGRKSSKKPRRGKTRA